MSYNETYNLAIGLMPSVATLSTSVEIIPSKYVVYLDVLTPQELEMLLNFCCVSEGEFIPSGVTTKVPDYRKSLLMFSPPVFKEFFECQVQKRLPKVFELLGITPFTPSQIEAQLTVSRHGDYFKFHTDSGSAETNSRIVSYVYYFGSHSWQGGELKLWDTKVINGVASKGDNSELFTPKPNSMIFFKSNVWHEVLPVVNPNGGFMDSRFTFNGWVRE
jgi:SM-20-related protein